MACLNCIKSSLIRFSKRLKRLHNLRELHPMGGLYNDIIAFFDNLPHSSQKIRFGLEPDPLRGVGTILCPIYQLFRNLTTVIPYLCSVCKSNKLTDPQS